MRMVCLWVGAVLVAGTLSAEPWVEARSAHFIVVSDAGAGDARRIAEHFEGIRGAIKLIWPWARVDPAVPMKVLVTRNEDGFRLIFPQWWEGKNRSHPVGGFAQGLAGPRAAVRADIAVPATPDVPNPYQIVQHEYVHFVIGMNFERVPVWLNEGLAEVLGGTTVHPEGVSMGRPIPWHLRLLRERALMPVEALFVVNRGSPEYTEENRTNLFYAESWAFVHYMLLDPQASKDPRLKGFVGKVVAGTEPSAALRAQGLNGPDLDRALQSYVRRVAFWKETIPSSPEVTRGITTADISEAAWLAACGAFLVETGQTAAGLKVLAQAEHLDAELATLQEATGLAMIQEKHMPEARERLEHAIRLDPSSATAHVMDALAILQNPSPGPESRTAARAHLDSALHLAPDYPLAHLLLAQILLADRSVDEAMAHAAKAASLQPGSGPSRLALAQAFSAAGRHADAAAQAHEAIELGVGEAETKSAQTILDAAEKQAPAVPHPAAVAPTGKPAAWGVFVNEDGKADVTAREQRVEIRVPAGAYDLGAEIGNVNAPRLLRPIEGNFVAQVTVANAPHPGPSKGSEQRRPFNGAGILLWLDDRNYLRLEFGAAVARTGNLTRFALFEERKDGLPVGGLTKADLLLEDAPALLKLERHGRAFVGFVRQGDSDWKPAGKFEADLPQLLYLGLAATNTTLSPFAATFEGFAVSPAP